MKFICQNKVSTHIYILKMIPSLPKDHPKRIFMDRYNGYLNSDVFEKILK